LAYTPQSPSTTLVASDMVGFGKNDTWVLTSNHLDGKTHSIPDQFNSGGGGVFSHTPPPPDYIQGYGGNYLYNDGHVDWRPISTLQMRYYQVYNGAPAARLAY
jgi:prepilin-type processing-associated H-X9-DG protein